MVGSDGGVLFANQAQLAVGSPSGPINRDEQGALVTLNPEVWTSTAFGGGVTYNHCGGWTEPYSNTDGYYGNATSVSLWRTVSSQPCGTSSRLYCFEQ